jgi:hypothetical protein
VWCTQLHLVPLCSAFMISGTVCATLLHSPQLSSALPDSPSNLSNFAPISPPLCHTFLCSAPSALFATTCFNLFHSGSNSPLYSTPLDSSPCYVLPYLLLLYCTVPCPVLLSHQPIPTTTNTTIILHLWFTHRYIPVFVE